MWRPFTWIRRKSISAHLYALVIAVGLIFVGLAIWSIPDDVEEARGAARGEAARLAEDAAAEIDHSIATGLASLASQAAQPGFEAVFASDEECVLSGGGTGVFPSGHVDIVAPDGRIACTSRRPSGGLEGAGYASVDWFDDLRGARGPIAVGPVDDPVDGSPVVVLGTPISGGYLVTTADATGLGRELARRFADERTRLIVTDGTTIAADSAAPERAGTPARAAPDRGAVDGELVDADADARIFASASVETLRWTVNAGVSSSAIRSDVYRQIPGRAAMTIGALVVLLLLAVAVRRAIGAPIVALTDVIRRTSAGEDVVAEVPTGPAEVASLTETFNRMRQVQSTAEAALVEGIEQQRAAAVELRRLAEMKDRFVSAVSHELRTPLTAIIGLAHTLDQQRDRLGEERTAEFLERLRNQATRLDDLLADLIDLSNLTGDDVTVDLEPADLRDVATRAVGRLGVTSHPVTVEVPHVEFVVDAAMVERIVSNLVDNAVRHTPRGTPIHVRCEQDDDAVTVIVDDEGPGIADDERDRIFEPFSHGADMAASPGVGIGLAMVSLLAQLHGGKAWVEDRPGGGSSFRVLIPHAPAA